MKPSAHPWTSRRNFGGPGHWSAKRRSGPRCEPNGRFAQSPRGSLGQDSWSKRCRRSGIEFNLGPSLRQGSDVGVNAVVGGSHVQVGCLAPLGKHHGSAIKGAKSQPCSMLLRSNQSLVSLLNQQHPDPNQVEEADDGSARRLGIESSVFGVSLASVLIRYSLLLFCFAFSVIAADLVQEVSGGSRFTPERLRDFIHHPSNVRNAVFKRTLHLPPVLFQNSDAAKIFLKESRAGRTNIPARVELFQLRYQRRPEALRFICCVC